MSSIKSVVAKNVPLGAVFGFSEDEPATFVRVLAKYNLPTMMHPSEGVECICVLQGEQAGINCVDANETVWMETYEQGGVH